MEEVSTDSLRKLAPCWTLAGDEKLLTILQNTHQKLLARCQETNSQLEQMASTLDDTNICLQNVNNQFMSLSSSQFVESRVYDDDADVNTDATPAKQDVSKSSPPDTVSMLKNSICVLESRHEVITIINDSDTSDTDDDIPDRQVMKAKDVYGDRPLPYIIGSEPWKNKWHAGLMAEDSDSESSTSKVDGDTDQYSHSEPEDFAPDSVADLQRPVAGVHVKNISESSSEAPLETSVTPKQTPADIATEIARRLGAGLPPPKMLEPEYDEPAPIKKIYKPQEPISSTIFPDEPPPLDEQVESDSDIFADLHRKQPYNQSYTRQDVTQELFGRSDDDEAGDIFSDIAKQPSADKPTSLFDAGPKPYMFEKQNKAAENPGNVQIEDENIEASHNRNFKKPVGGISVFGANQGADSIGAAILSRKQLKSSSSDDDGSENDSLSQTSPIKQQSKREKDIFEDLFAKGQRKNIDNKIIPKVNNDIKSNIQTKKETNTKKDTSKPIDLFSDNLFDDIDDIFTTNIAKTTKQTKDTTVFESDDDLFSKTVEPKTDKLHVKKEKSLFDSSDDLFSDKPSASSQAFVTETKEQVAKSNEVPPTAKPIQSIILMDDDKDIFTDVAVNNFTTKQNISEKNINLSKSIEISKNVFNSPSLFDDEDDINDLFKEPLKSKSVSDNKLRDTEKLSNEAKLPTDNNSERNNLRLNNDFNDTANKTVVNVVGSLSVLSENNNKVPIENRNTDSCDINDEAKNNMDTIITATDINTKTISDSKNVNTSYKDIDQQHFTNEPLSINHPSSNSSILSDDNNKTRVIDSDVDIENTNITIKNTLEVIQNEINESQPDLTKIGNDNNSETKSSSDIFSNILTEPPAFEKPKEPKKSKNVNALFDDDSDDEFLFFKKNDVVSDDNTEEIVRPMEKPFPIFTDLPPDSDFNQLTDDLDNNLFRDMPASRSTLEKAPNNQDNLSELDNNMTTENNENKNLLLATSTAKSDLTIRVPETNEKVADIYKLLSEDTPNNAELFKERANDFTQDNIFKQTAVEKTDVIFSDNVIEADTTKLEKSLLVNETDRISYESDDIFKKKYVNLSPNTTKNDDYVSVGGDPIKSQPILSSQTKLSLIDDQDLDYKPDEEQFKSSSRKKTSRSDKHETIRSDESISQEKLFSEPSSLVEKSEKKVGKLKVGLNINVKALLPGASPKKVLTVDNLDGKTHAKFTSEDEKFVQATIFEEKPDAEILDNTFSKERPRIQVKRRPSTRKARKEAVRKSGIDFGEDSTDNSNSVHDLPKSQTEIQDNTLTNVESVSSSDTEEANSQDIVKNVDEKCGLKHKKETNLSDSSPDLMPIKSRPENTIKLPVTQSAQSNSTTKIVYILNDEDIFNTSSIVTTDKPLENSQTIASKTPNTSHTLTSEADKNLATNLVQNTTSGKISLTIDTYSSDGFSINKESTISTLGATYKDVKTKESKSSIFGEDDDNGIFENKKPVAKVSIFDSDSEDELFGFSKKKVKKVDSNVEVRGSLFGDDDDDDNLFGIKTKKYLDPQTHTSKSVSSVKESQKSTEPVFEDPLSMFGDDD